MKLVPSSVRVEVDINGTSQASLTTTKLIYICADIYISGACATVASTFIGIFAFSFFIYTFITTTTTITGPCLSSVSNPLRIQVILLSIATLFLLTSMVPYMLFFCTRSASVKAFVGGSQIQDSVVQSVARSLGVTGEYKSVSYRQCWYPHVIERILTICLSISSETRSDLPMVQRPLCSCRYWRARRCCNENIAPSRP